MPRPSKNQTETEPQKIPETPPSQPEVKRSRDETLEAFQLQENKNPDDFE